MKSFLTLNASITPNSALVRNDTIADKPYLVVPMVMMVEGVHVGSSGPLFYPEEELSKLPIIWNTKPVVVYHPQANGAHVSACSPEVLSKYSIGIIMNATWDGINKRLLAEAWLEEPRIKTVDSRVGEAIKANEMMEVSIGVFSDVETVEETTWTSNSGTEETYKGIARNLKPDHLAVLPDKIGACSIADGGGLLRNEAHRAMGAEGKPNVAELLGRMVGHFGMKLTNNELSYSNIHRELHTQLKDKLTLGDEDYAYVEDVYSNFFVYEYNRKLYRLDYTVEGNTISVTGEPVEVKRVTEYRTIDGAFVGNSLPSNNITNNNKTDMKKKDIIASLVATGVWNASQNEFLETLEENQLQEFLQNAQEATKPKETTPEASIQTPAPKVNKEETPVTLEAYVSAAPAEIRDTLVAMQQRVAAEKDTCVKEILACASNRFTDAQLRAKSLDELQCMSALIAKPESEDSQHRTYRIPDGREFHANSQSAGDQEPLVMPASF